MLAGILSIRNGYTVYLKAVVSTSTIHTNFQLELCPPCWISLFTNIEWRLHRFISVFAISWCWQTCATRLEVS